MAAPGRAKQKDGGKEEHQHEASLAPVDCASDNDPRNRDVQGASHGKKAIAQARQGKLPEKDHGEESPDQKAPFVGKGTIAKPVADKGSPESCQEYLQYSCPGHKSFRKQHVRHLEPDGQHEQKDKRKGRALSATAFGLFAKPALSGFGGKKQGSSQSQGSNSAQYENKSQPWRAHGHANLHELVAGHKPFDCNGKQRDKGDRAHPGRAEQGGNAPDNGACRKSREPCPVAVGSKEQKAGNKQKRDSYLAARRNKGRSCGFRTHGIVRVQGLLVEEDKGCPKGLYHPMGACLGKAVTQGRMLQADRTLSISPGGMTLSENFIYRPIGIIHSEHTDPAHGPIQPCYADGCLGTVEVFEQYTQGLKDLDGFSLIILLYQCHRAKPCPMLV